MLEKEVYHWYVARTAYRSEKKVKGLLNIAGIESYLLLKTVMRMWGAEEKNMQVPVVPACIFIRVSGPDFAMIQFMKEISLLLDKEGTPVCIPDHQMEEIMQKPENPDAASTLIFNILEEIR